MPVIKNGEYELTDKPTERQVIEAQQHTIKQLQEFIEHLPGWDYVNELKAKIAFLEAKSK